MHKTAETIDIGRIEAARQNAVIGRKLIVFKSTASTNDAAWRYASRPDHHGLCVLAEHQTRGRGRRGRRWHSQPGQSILCSILLLHQSIGAELLTLTAAVAAAEAINRILQAQPHPPAGRAGPAACCIKWPNDILLSNKKAAGILVEQQTIRQQHNFVVGIGINCSQTADFFDACRLGQPATSLAIETGRPVDRTAVVCEWLDQFEYWLGQSSAHTAVPADGTGSRDLFEQNPVIVKWLELSGMLGRRATVECNGKQYCGTCRGIHPAEGLILQLDGGGLGFFHAAQTSLLALA
ncbi:MAG: biotin--[acetyl-CoA-carboxylase] ligase [Phycisphaerae bacterium]|nr:biotin--[acetyl-CoA-carboxylase] ligase [Phycisphaerae bacterium]